MTLVPPNGATPLSSGLRPWTLQDRPWHQGWHGTPRARVIIDNDFSGDPDDLFQVVHHLLSPSVEICGVIGSHLADGDPFDPGPDTATHACAVLYGLFERMGLKDDHLIVAGAQRGLVDVRTPQESPAARLIVAEALRADERPLYVVAGGGLTDLASAYLLEPAIADRLTVVWIGGGEHEGLACPPPDAMPIEYNLLIDVVAGQVVFGHSDLTVWQAPRDVYRQCLVSDAELAARVATCGELGAYLYAELTAVVDRATGERRGPAETYALGDSPLVLLTALQSLFEADPSSSAYVTCPTPAIGDDGRYRPVDGARPMRVYTRVDTRLMFEDMFSKIRAFTTWCEA